MSAHCGTQQTRSSGRVHPACCGATMSKYFHAYGARVLTVIYLSGTREEKLPTMVFTMGAVSPRMPSMMPTSELDQPYADWVKMGKPSI